MHPIQRRFLAEDLVRLRRSDEQHRVASSQRRGRVDPNPHQIDAVVFALKRLTEGGCILADEVGLGKTIEAGLVIAQRLAEGASRVLVIVPKALLGQWQNELLELFGIHARDAKSDMAAIDEPGVFLVGREHAGSEAGAAAFGACRPFDLCVIDEAHEVFAGLYKRFDKHGRYKEDATQAQMAHRVRGFLRGDCPVMLLTATPIQNSLAELWGLVQYVEPTGTLLGNLATFREVFCDGDDRYVVPSRARELRNRLDQVLKRTLRREAQDFLERPFVGRTTRLFEYPMTREERALYDDVTAYLLEPSLCAFQGAPRRLLLIGFHRRMASSIRALAASLKNVAARLDRALRTDESPASDGSEVLRDFEDLEDELEPLSGEPDEPDGQPTKEQIEAELERVKEFIERAEKLPSDGKAKALLRAVRLVGKRHKDGVSSGKIVVFTESLTTQEYLRDLLIEDGIADDDITLFRGTNESPRARAALDRWMEEVGKQQPSSSRPARHIATRLALVHEFRTRSRIFISTEAGAKGLNLQFCDTLINYDLPWNPQRIEQRIGRCHRYGQTRDVTVISFLAKDNEAQRLTFEILSQKLDLFGTVLDASDQVLHQPDVDAPESVASAFGEGFEKSLARIYERARTRDEIEQELRALRDEIGERRAQYDQEQVRMVGLIQSELHEIVQEKLRRFRSIREELPAGLAELDEALERVVRGYLESAGIEHELMKDDGRRLLRVGSSLLLPGSIREGVTVILGGASRDDRVEPLHVAHPLVEAAVEDARRATSRRLAVRLSRDGQSGLPRGRGRLVVEKVHHAGFEVVEQLVSVAVIEDGTWLTGEAAAALFDLEAVDAELTAVSVDDEELDDAVEEAIFDTQEAVLAREQETFEQTQVRLQRFMDDRALVLRRQRTELTARIAKAEEDRDAAMGADTRKKAVDQIRRLEHEVEELDEQIARLSNLEDDDYARWQHKARERRFAEPQRERILDVEIELA